jgi:hypothetical protein
VSPDEYNYSVFEMDREMPIIEAFGELPLRPGGRAPSFPLRDLESGEAVEMKEFWRDGLVVFEFGSFT